MLCSHSGEYRYNATFLAAINYAVGAVGTNPVSIAVGDFNGDGKLDLTTANEDGTASILLRNSANTGFVAATSYTAGTNPGSVAVGDFNEDGKLDVVTANTGSNNVSVLLNAPPARPSPLQITQRLALPVVVQSTSLKTAQEPPTPSPPPTPTQGQPSPTAWQRQATMTSLTLTAVQAQSPSKLLPTTKTQQTQVAITSMTSP
ncbi:MAG: FG-GAP repeat domain-containing protein [Cyanobacteriota bacterium]